MFYFMTLEKLLGANADYLESLTDAELKAFFTPYLTVTRPSPEASKRMEKIGESTRVNKVKAQSKSAKLDKLDRLFRDKFGEGLL